MKKKKDEPLWCRLYRDEVIRPAQKERLTERTGRTVASQKGFYLTAGWKRIRDKRKLNNPLCQHCEAKGFLNRMQVVDHIIPVEEAPHLALDYENTQSLCNFCHNIKTIRDAKEKKQRERLASGKKLMNDLEKQPDTRGVGQK